MAQTQDPVVDRARPDPNERLVKVFDTEQESEAMVVKGLLESNGIESEIRAIDAGQDMFPGVGGSVIMVREDDAEQARRVITEFQQEPDMEVEDAADELASSGEPPTAKA